MEIVIPRTKWIPALGYEVFEDILEGLKKNLLESLVEESQKIFGTAQEKSM